MVLKQTHKDEEEYKDYDLSVVSNRTRYIYGHTSYIIML